jgi:hypothetical protein
LRISGNAGAGPGQRLLFAVIGLVAGNAALLIYFLYGTLSLRAHVSRARFALAGYLEIFCIYAVVSIIGVPIGLVFPARLVRAAWPIRILIGAVLGPLALLPILVMLFAAQGRLSEFSLARTESLWLFSILISTVSFLVYAALLGRRLPPH